MQTANVAPPANVVSGAQTEVPSTAMGSRRERRRQRAQQQMLQQAQGLVVVVFKRDGSVARVPVAQLRDNGAMERWRADPTITLRECNDVNCRDAAACRFAHLTELQAHTTSEDAREDAPHRSSPATVEREEAPHRPTSPTGDRSAPRVPFHHVFHHIPPPAAPAASPLRPAADSTVGQPPFHHVFRHNVPPVPPTAASRQVLLGTAPRLHLHGAFGMEAHLNHVTRQILESLGLSHRQRPPPANPDRTCNICFEEFAHARALYSCSEMHNTCSRCLSQYILTNWRDNRKASSGELRCCQPGCTSRPLTTQEVVKFVTSKAALEVYIDHTNRQTAAQCFAEAHAIVLQEVPEARVAADALLQKQLQKAMSAARMCPNCQFGPIDFFGCDDLAHHHEEERNGARTRNSCPQCGYFSAAIQAWKRWDGVSRSFEGPVKHFNSEVDDEHTSSASAGDASSAGHTDEELEPTTARNGTSLVPLV
jgi:hypothetical protein